MFFICSGINGCFGVIYLYLGEKDMKRLMFLGVFLLFCCGVVSSANAAVCCTISDNFGNKAEHSATNSCTALGGVSGGLPKACSAGVCDVETGWYITCAAGLTKCCVYDAACGNTNNLKCSCVVNCEPCNGVQSEKQYKGTNGCTNYQSVQCKPSYSEKQTLNRYDWIKAVVTTQTTACSKGCYLENDVCNKCPGDRTTDGDRNSGGLDSCKLNCDEGLGLTAEKDSCVCDSGWYGDNKTCEKCPDGSTSEKGMATTKADCFLSGGKYADEKGWFETESQCNYDVSQN